MKCSFLIFSLLTLSLTIPVNAAQTKTHAIIPGQRTMLLRVPASLLQRCASSLESIDTLLSKSLTNQDEYFEKQQKSPERVDGCPEMGAGILSLGTFIALLVVKTGKNVCSAGARMLGGQTYVR